MDDSDFRTAQALGDLDRVLATGPIRDPWAIAFDCNAEADRVCAAVAAILRDAITADTGDPGLDLLWFDRADDFRRAPAPVRAALMNGFDHQRARGLIEKTCAPTSDDLITHPLPRIEAELIAAARRMTADEMTHVAQADYGCDADQHRAALVTLLADDSLRYPPGEAWFPAEVIELVSHVPGAPGHIPCLAIVLLAALRDGDLHGYAEYRFANQSAEIDAMAAPVRAIFFAAFRHLYESCRNWGTWPTDFTRSGAWARVTLPWTDLP